MRYYYEKPQTYTVSKGRTEKVDAELYSECTLYEVNGKGLRVVQLRFNPKLKVFFYGPIDDYLIDDIFSREGFLENLSDPPYKTIEVRQLMWKLRMKPLKNSHKLQLL